MGHRRKLLQSARWSRLQRRLALLDCYILALVVWQHTLLPPRVWALPEDPQVVAGDASFEQPDNQTLQITASENSVIEFGSYDIAANEAVTYVLPGASAATLSRVTGGGASTIAGRLISNGIVFLVNPAGITFSPTANIQVAGLIASSLVLQNADFLAGQYRFGAPDQTTLAAVRNEGTITVTDGGYAALLGGAVANTGTITAPVGAVALAAGQVVTVGVSPDNAIAIAIEEPVAEQVRDTQGQPITTQIENTGTIQSDSGHVTLTAKAADQLFDLAVNQEGIVRADTVVVGETGAIEIVASGPVRSTGSMQAAGGQIHVGSTDADVFVGGQYTAPGGDVQVEAGRDLTVVSETRTVGPTALRAKRDLKVEASLTTESGNLTLAADSDRDGIGRFLQAIGSVISTLFSGDITISSSGESTLGSVNAAGSLKLESAGAPATYRQHPGTSVTTGGSVEIQPGTTLDAGTGAYSVGRDWINLGTFLPGQSSVWLTGPEPAVIRGSTTFHDFGSTVPGKTIHFEALTLQEILGTATFRGEFGNLLLLRSTLPGTQFSLLPRGTEKLFRYVEFRDAWVRGPPLAPANARNAGNTTGIDFSLAGPIWTGAGGLSVWSDPLNWDGGFVPGIFDLVRFTQNSALRTPHSLIDPAFSGSITGLTLEAGYTGTVTLGRDLLISENVILAGGTLAAASYTLTVGGNWTLQGGQFVAGTSTVIFNSALESRIFGSTLFYNFTSLAPDKRLVFEAGSTQTILGTWLIRGAYAQHVRLVSSTPSTLVSPDPATRWFVDPRGPVDISYAWVEDSHNLSQAEIIMIESTNRGNSVGWDPTAIWVGGNNGIWSTGSNWSGTGGVAPGAGDDVVFENGPTGTNFNNSVDASFGGTIGSLTTRTGFNRTITLNRSLTITTSSGRTGEFIFGSNVTFDQGAQTLNIAGDFSLIAGATFTKASGGQALTFDGTGNLADNNAVLQDLGAVVIGGTSTTRTLSDSVKMTSLTINSGNIFSVSTGSFEFSASAAVVNNGTFRLYGGNTFTNVTNLDTDSGTVEYTGNGDAFPDTYTLQDFGATDYYNLTVALTDSNDILQLSGAALTVAGALTVSGGSLSLNGQNLSLTGAFSNTATLRLRGSETVTGLTQDIDSGTWTYVGDGDGLADTVTLKDFGATDYYHLTINSTDGTTDTFQPDGALDVDGAFTLTAGTFSQGTNTMNVAGNFSLSASTTFTKSSNSSALTLDGTATLSDSNATKQDLGAVVIGGSSTPRQLTTAVNMTSLTINSGNTFTLTGNNFAFSASAAVVNNGTFRLQGGEGLTNVTNLDIDSGTVEYTGTPATPETITLIDFGATDYYNLNLSSGQPTDTFQPGGALDVDGAFTLPAGTFNQGTNTMNVAGNFTVDIGMTFTKSSNSSALTLDGTGNLQASSQDLGVVVIGGTSTTRTLTGPTAQATSLTINSGNTFSLAGVSFSFSASAAVVNNGTFRLQGGEGLTNVTNLDIDSGTVEYTGTPATPETITLKDFGATDYYNLTINSTDGTTDTFQPDGALDVDGVFTLTAGTFNQSTSTMNVAGNFSLSASTTFTKSSDSSALTFDGTGNLTDSNATKQDLGAVVIGGSSTTRTLTAATRMTSLTINSGNTFSLAGNNFEFASAAAVSNNGTFRLRGSETLTSVNNLDTDSGTVTYVGDGDSAADTFTLTDFGGTDYYNLTINTTDTNDTVQSAGAKAIAGALTVTSGTYDANGNTTTITGLATVNGGTYTASTATQTFNGGLTVSSGTFTGSSGTADVNGALTLSGGTLTAPSGTLSVSGNFAHTGGTFTHNSGTVTLDGSDQTVSGSTTFYSLTKTVTVARTLTFEAGATQTITGTNTLTLQGQSGALLSLRSSSSGTQWRVDPSGSRTVSFLDVQDSNNINATTISCTNGCVDSGRNTGWTFSSGGGGGGGSGGSGSGSDSTVELPPPPVVESPVVTASPSATLGPESSSASTQEAATASSQASASSSDTAPSSQAASSSQEAAGVAEQPDGSSPAGPADPWVAFGTEAAADMVTEVTVYEGAVYMICYGKDRKPEPCGVVAAGQQTAVQWKQAPAPVRRLGLAAQLRGRYEGAQLAGHRGPLPMLGRLVAFLTWQLADLLDRVAP